MTSIDLTSFSISEDKEGAKKQPMCIVFHFLEEIALYVGIFALVFILFVVLGSKGIMAH